MIIKDYFCVHFINQLVKYNPNLTDLVLYRKNFAQDLYLVDTIKLETLDVKFNQTATLYLGSNFSLRSITSNCRVDLASAMPNLREINFKKGYRPGKDESERLLLMACQLKKLSCTGI